MTDIKKLSVEELMQIAKTPIPEDEFKKFPPVKRFLLSEDITTNAKTDYPVPAMLIYDRYEKWCDLFKQKALDNKAFFKELALYFNKKTTNKGNFYLMSPKGFDLSPAYLTYVNQQQKPKKRISNGKETTKKKTEEEHQD